MQSLHKNVYRERVEFSKIKSTVPIPNLIEIQKKSYERFLQMYTPPAEREDVGLQSVFKSVFPISDFRENSSLGLSTTRSDAGILRVGDEARGLPLAVGQALAEIRHQRCEARRRMPCR
jgi:DNA-directed RNA polymerase subunit beta